MLIFYHCLVKCSFTLSMIHVLFCCELISRWKTCVVTLAAQLFSEPFDLYKDGMGCKIKLNKYDQSTWSFKVDVYRIPVVCSWVHWQLLWTCAQSANLFPVSSQIAYSCLVESIAYIGLVFSLWLPLILVSAVFSRWMWRRVDLFKVFTAGVAHWSRLDKEEEEKKTTLR